MLSSLLQPSDVQAFSERRERLRKLRQAADAPVVLPSGWARPRNFAHNVYPFRAESHFLYFVGHHLEGALLVFDAGEVAIYVDRPDPEHELWSGRAPTLEEWEDRLGLPVRPLEALKLSSEPVCLPPQDEETALWLTDLLGREVEPQAGPHLGGADAHLADQVIDCRLRHDASAIVQLRCAAQASAVAHRVGMRATRGATAERQVRGEIEGALIGAGLTPSYTSIVTTHGEILHADKSNGALRDGDLLLCDVGGETPEGFTADITRTWPTSGRFSATQRDIYQAVLDVQKSAIAGVRPGVHYATLHQQAARDLAASLVHLGILKGSVDQLYACGAVSVFFPHGLGHLLGLDVHEMEDLGDRAGYAPGEVRSTHPSESALRLRRILEAGMCVTIEPGFYQIPLLLERARQDATVAPLIDWDRLRSFSDVRGIRIEDDVLVTANGSEVLSENAPKEVADLEACLAGEDAGR